MHGTRIPGVLVGLLLCFAAMLGRADDPRKLTVATWNLEWFYDHYTGDNFQDLSRKQSPPTRDDWDWKLAEVARVVAAIQPDILAVQEIENRRVLWQLQQKLKRDHAQAYRFAFIEGDDFFTEQDVGLLYCDGLVRYSRGEQTDAMRASKRFYSVNKHLIADFEFPAGDRTERLTIFNGHFRAMTKGAAIRQRQARLVRHWLGEKVAAGENVIVLGDLNSDLLAAQTTPESEIGVLLCGETESSADDFLDTLLQLTGEHRGTHLNGQQYDRILISRALQENDPSRTDLVFRSISLRRDLVIRGERQDKDHMDIYWTIPQAERDVSDHYPLVAEFEFAGE